MVSTGTLKAQSYLTILVLTSPDQLVRTASGCAAECSPLPVHFIVMPHSTKRFRWTSEGNYTDGSVEAKCESSPVEKEKARGLPPAGYPGACPDEAQLPSPTQHQSASSSTFTSSIDYSAQLKSEDPVTSIVSLKLGIIVSYINKAHRYRRTLRVMAFFLTCGTHTFTSALAGYENVTVRVLRIIRCC